MLISQTVTIRIWVIICCFFLTFKYFIPHDSSITSTTREPTTHHATHVQSSHHSHSPIPAIVHFTHLKRDESTKVFELNFQKFLSLYGAIVHNKPDTVYIHTDFPETSIENARTQGNVWTRQILKFPQVKVNRVVPPTEINGHGVHVEAKSDFVRWDIMRQFGGTYMDWDVLALRDSTILRHAGFKAIAGRQDNWDINTGIFMAKNTSALAELMTWEGRIVYDGSWGRHATELLHKVGERIVAAPGEMLVMDQLAMNPGGWSTEQIINLFRPHIDQAGVPVGKELSMFDEKDAITRWRNRDKKVAQWEMDFSATYFLHAFNNKFISGATIPDFYGVNVTYVMARNSNYALAAYPILAHALRAGLIPSEELPSTHKPHPQPVSDVVPKASTRSE